jgi:RHS repeat-associated protein
MEISKNLNVNFGDNDRPYYFSHWKTGVSGFHTEYMVYDGAGNRKSKLSYLDGVLTSATHYFGNGKEIREFADASTNIFYPYDSFGKMQWSDEGFDPPEIYIKNYLGSTVSVATTAGDYSYKTEYEPYGKLRDQVISSSNPVTEKFTGKEHDEEIDLDYFGARYFDSDLGVWISPDAARQFASPYAYCQTPVNSIDPDGNWTVKGFLGYGYAGALEVGYNYGKWTWGLYGGYGLGGKIEMTPYDQAPGAVENGAFLDFRGEVQGSFALGPFFSSTVGFEMTALKIDQSMTTLQGAWIKGSVRVRELPLSIKLGGKVGLVWMNNLNSGLSDLRLDIKSDNAFTGSYKEFGVGAFVVGGVRGSFDD